MGSSALSLVTWSHVGTPWRAVISPADLAQGLERADSDIPGGSIPGCIVKEASAFSLKVVFLKLYDLLEQLQKLAEMFFSHLC